MSFIEHSPNMSSPEPTETVNLGEAWHALVQKRGTIARITGLFILLGVAFVLLSHPRFNLGGSLYTRGLQPSG